MLNFLPFPNRLFFAMLSPFLVNTLSCSSRLGGLCGYRTLVCSSVLQVLTLSPHEGGLAQSFSRAYWLNTQPLGSDTWKFKSQSWLGGSGQIIYPQGASE